MIFKLNTEINKRQITVVEQIDLKDLEIERNKIVPEEKAYVPLRAGKSML